MGWYEAIKDGISIAQQADNLPLVQNLIEAQKQILDLIQENSTLKEENKLLQEKLQQKGSITRHHDTYITVSDSDEKILYCATCWDNSQKLIQLSCNENGSYKCPTCNNIGFYDKELHKKKQQKFTDSLATLNHKPHGF